MAMALRVSAHDDLILLWQRSRELHALAREVRARARKSCERASAAIQRADAVATRAYAIRRAARVTVGSSAD